MKYLIGFLLTVSCMAQPVVNPYPPVTKLVPGGSTGGGTTTVQTPSVFLLCASACTTSDQSNWKWTSVYVQTVVSCTIDAAVYPTGAAITVDIKKNPTPVSIGVWTGGTTIFTSTLPTLTAGSSSFNTQSGIAAAGTLAVGDYLVAMVTGVGSTIAGQGVNLTCKLQ